MKDAHCLRVFAAAEGGHVASTAVRLDGESVAHELADRIYVDTDRPRYFAGETVHVRGCARHADGDHFMIEPGKKLTIEVLGDADRRLRRREVTLSAAGTFSCDFLLPAEMPEGAYKILVHDQAGHRQAVDFQIGRPEEETLRLVLDLPKTVYYRGETIEGTLRAVLPQDRPLAGVKVTYKLGDVPTTTATTDARGEVHFAIPTAELESYGRMAFEAAIPSRSVSVRREVTVATQGFSIGLETTRPVFVAGESVRSPREDDRRRRAAMRGKTAPEGLPARARRRDNPRGTGRGASACHGGRRHGPADAQAGQRRRARHPCNGNRSLRQYHCPRTATDAFPATTIRSGCCCWSIARTSRPATRPRRRSYWRGKPALAVVTCHFDRLIQQRQIALQTGMNRLQIPVTAAMAPGFTLAVSVMADQRDRCVITLPASEIAARLQRRDDRLHEAACCAARRSRFAGEDRVPPSR